MVEGIEKFCPNVDLVLGKIAAAHKVEYSPNQGGLTRSLFWKDRSWLFGVNLELLSTQRRTHFLEILVSVGPIHMDRMAGIPLTSQKRQLKTPVPGDVLERSVSGMVQWTAIEAQKSLTH